jgi:predicted dehydrogenase
MCAAAAAAAAVFAVGYTMHFSPPLLRMKELLSSGALGKPVRAPARQYSDLLYGVHRSHRWKVHMNHRNGVPWHPLP